jgi:hypothetical protein
MVGDSSKVETKNSHGLPWVLFVALEAAASGERSVQSR